MSLQWISRVRPSPATAGRTLKPKASSIRRSYETVESCPSPTCACAEMPDLEIDHVKPLANTVPRHHKHLVVHTCRSDWASRIEDGLEGGQIHPNRAMEFKNLTSPRGAFSDVRHPATHPQTGSDEVDSQQIIRDTTVMVTNSTAGPTDYVSLFPAGAKFQLNNDSNSVADFVRWTLSGDDKPVKPLKGSGEMVKSEQLTGDQHFAPQQRNPCLKAEKYDNAVVYICGHMSRDKRCGILGPLLRDEFQKQLDRESFSKLGIKPPCLELISHVGGHIFAGNVIIYMPDSAGMPPRGIWYGRVEPKHVEGILKETVGRGRIIKELFRGGIDFKGDPLQLR